MRPGDSPFSPSGPQSQTNLLLFLSGHGCSVFRPVAVPIYLVAVHRDIFLHGAPGAVGNLIEIVASLFSVSILDPVPAGIHIALSPVRLVVEEEPVSPRVLIPAGSEKSILIKAVPVGDPAVQDKRPLAGHIGAVRPAEFPSVFC